MANGIVHTMRELLKDSGPITDLYFDDTNVTYPIYLMNEKFVVLEDEHDDSKDYRFIQSFETFNEAVYHIVALNRNNREQRL